MKVVLMVGNPGSGKSTLAQTKFPEYVRISQDDHGSDRTKTLAAFNKALADDKDVILDRCNNTVKQRAEWLKIARIYGADIQAIVLVANTELCISRIINRKNHPTLGIEKQNIDKIRSIVRRFNSETEHPTFDEPFDSILFIRVKS